MGQFVGYGGYAILLVLVMIIIFRIIMLQKQKKVSDEKTRFFINTAHDIRTPLTLIKLRWRKS